MLDLCDILSGIKYTQLQLIKNGHTSPGFLQACHINAFCNKLARTKFNSDRELLKYIYSRFNTLMEEYTTISHRLKYISAYEQNKFNFLRTKLNLIEKNSCKTKLKVTVAEAHLLILIKNEIAKRLKQLF